MKFPKEFLREMEWATPEGVAIVDEDILRVGRWSISYRRVFSFGGKFYETKYSKGATEVQDERPYEYDDDEIECPEVVPVERTVTVYEVRR